MESFLFFDTIKAAKDQRKERCRWMELKIGKRIQDLRKQKGLTQEQVAAALNISAAAGSKGDGYDISGYYNPKPAGKAFGRERGCSAGLSGADDGRRMYEADGESGYTVFDKKLGRRTAVL